MTSLYVYHIRRDVRAFINKQGLCNLQHNLIYIHFIKLKKCLLAASSHILDLYFQLFVTKYQNLI